jgi:hypothetical protein
MPSLEIVGSKYLTTVLGLIMFKGNDLPLSLQVANTAKAY